MPLPHTAATAWLLLTLWASSAAGAGIPLADRQNDLLSVSGWSSDFAFVESDGNGFLVTHSMGARFAIAVDSTGRMSVPNHTSAWPGTITAGPGRYIALVYRNGKNLLLHLDRIGTETRAVEIGLRHNSLRVLSANHDRILLLDQTMGLHLIDYDGAHIASHQLRIKAYTSALQSVQPQDDGFIVLTAESDGRLVLQTFRNSGDADTPILVSDGTPSSAAVFTSIGDSVMVVWSTGGNHLTLHSAIVKRDGTVVAGMVRLEFMKPLMLVPRGDGALLIGVRTGSSLPLPGAGFALQLDRSGRWSDEATGLTGGRRLVDVATNGHLVYLLVSEPAPIGEKLVGLAMPIHSPGTLLREEVLSIGPIPQTGPTLAVRQGGGLAAWHEASGSRFTIRGRRLVDGIPSGEPFDIHLSSEPISEPQITATANVYLVTWLHRGGIRAARVDSTGHVLDVIPLEIMYQNLHGGPWPRRLWSVASDGLDFAVVWMAGDIRGTIVTAAGIVRERRGLTTPPPFAQNEWESQKAPSLVWTGGRYLLVWTQERDRGGTFYNTLLWRQVRSIELDRQLQPLPVTERIAVTDALHLAVATDGDTVLIVTARGDATVALLIGHGGKVVGETTLWRGGAGDWWSTNVYAAWNGREYLVAWRTLEGITVAAVGAFGSPDIMNLQAAPVGGIAIAGANGDFFITTSEIRAEGLRPMTARAFVYRRADFTPARPRSRAVSR